MADNNKAKVMTGIKAGVTVPEKGVVDLTKRVESYATAKHKYKSTGSKLSLTQAATNHLVNKGWASLKKVEAAEEDHTDL